MGLGGPVRTTANHSQNNRNKSQRFTISAIAKSRAHWKPKARIWLNPFRWRKLPLPAPFQRSSKSLTRLPDALHSASHKLVPACITTRINQETTMALVFLSRSCRAITRPISDSIQQSSMPKMVQERQDKLSRSIRVASFVPRCEHCLHISHLTAGNVWLFEHAGREDNDQTYSRIEPCDTHVYSSEN